MKKILFILFTALTLFYFTSLVLAENNIAQNLTGQILLQVESVGEAWYINTADYKKYYLGRPRDAFNIMRNFGLGIKHDELVIYLNNNFPRRLAGKIMLDVEANGEAYYVYPDDLKGYYLGRPIDAWNIMRKLSLGITNNNLYQISTGYIFQTLPSNPPTPPTPDEENILFNTADAIREGNIGKAVTYFIPSLQKSAEYSLNALNNDGKLAFANIFSSATLTSSTDKQKVYSTEVYFGLGGYNVTVNFEVEKQDDGSWLITNL